MGFVPVDIMSQLWHYYRTVEERKKQFTARPPGGFSWAIVPVVYAV